MPDVLIIAPVPEIPSRSPLASSLLLEMKRAILSRSEASSSDPALADRVDICLASELELRSQEIYEMDDLILCPLTLNLPEWLAFPGKETFSACANIQAMRARVAEWQFPIGDGTHWLPIVLTAKGALFGEVITQAAQETLSYRQPLHLVDAQRQPLYQLGQQLVRSLSASPGVYLMQFGLQENRVWFDRLIPFPDLPAIASVGVQTPDLFQCHWLCLTHQPIRDLQISA
ncbi:MAG: hypothetical protein NW224_11720 [Leptolyngbyaceae cyanobacterium bins.302]|nr:hypothetical protein [Leptolyngbyaceae cyanobacterium bins.302]